MMPSPRSYMICLDCNQWFDGLAPAADHACLAAHPRLLVVWARDDVLAALHDYPGGSLRRHLEHVFGEAGT